MNVNHSVILVSTLVALVACNSDDRTARQTSSPPATESSSTADAGYGKSQVEAGALQAPSATMQSQTSRPYTPQQPSAKTDVGRSSDELIREPAPAPAAGTQSGSTGASTDVPDRRNEEQRGSILTEDGAVDTEVDGAAAADPNLPRVGESAERDSQRSTQFDIAEDLATDEATLGTTETERALVQRVRQAVVNDESLSLTAKSVQIRAQGNDVILQGKVDSQREKAQIGSTAFRASGGKQIINQLEVRGDR
jgi:hypothetical protein